MFFNVDNSKFGYFRIQSSLKTHIRKWLKCVMAVKDLVEGPDEQLVVTSQMYEAGITCLFQY